jgi:hypothetical protein
MLTLLRLKLALALRRPCVVALADGAPLTLRGWEYEQYVDRYPLLVAATKSLPHAIKVLLFTVDAAELPRIEQLSARDTRTAAAAAVRYIGETSLIRKFQAFAATMKGKTYAS